MMIDTELIKLHRKKVTINNNALSIFLCNFKA